MHLKFVVLTKTIIQSRILTSKEPSCRITLAVVKSRVAPVTVHLVDGRQLAGRLVQAGELLRGRHDQTA